MLRWGGLSLLGIPGSREDGVKRGSNDSRAHPTGPQIPEEENLSHLLPTIERDSQLRGFEVAKLPEQFKSATKNVEPEEADKTNASEAHKEVRAVLEADETLAQHQIDTLLIGSYGRKVSIRRIKDVDVFSMLEKDTDDLDPADLLSHFRSVLEDEYGDRVTPQDRSVKVDFPLYNLAVDAVPARPLEDHWEIPDRDGGWEQTNPLELGRITSELNDQHELAGHGIYVPTVKLVRQVPRAALIDKPSGLYFEILTLHAFQDNELEADSQAEYLTLALEGTEAVMLDALINGLPDPTLDGEIIDTSATDEQLQAAYAKLASAASDAREALNELDDCASAKMWRDLLGKDPEGEFVFPMPEHCNEDGSRAFVAVQPGESRVPRGNDRYA